MEDEGQKESLTAGRRQLVIENRIRLALMRRRLIFGRFLIEMRKWQDPLSAPLPSTLAPRQVQPLSDPRLNLGAIAPNQLRAVSGNTPAMTAKQMTQMRWMSVEGGWIRGSGSWESRPSPTHPYTHIQSHLHRHKRRASSTFPLPAVYAKSMPATTLLMGGPGYQPQPPPGRFATRWAVRRLGCHQFFSSSCLLMRRHLSCRAQFAPNFGISRIGC